MYLVRREGLQRKQYYHESETVTESSEDDNPVSRNIVRKSWDLPKNSDNGSDSDSITNSEVSSSLHKYDVFSMLQSADHHSLEFSAPRENTVIFTRTSNMSSRQAPSPDPVPRRSTQTRKEPNRHGD